MSSSSRNNATVNFRPVYLVRTTSSQQAQYQQDQAAYSQVPRDIRQDISRHAERVNSRTQQWEQRYMEREKAWEETETARTERRNRYDPDIQYPVILRNKKNREEHALAKLDHAQRDYTNALKRGGGHVDTINITQRNRIPETSKYSAPDEIQNGICRHADYRPVELPSFREYWRPS